MRARASGAERPTGTATNGGKGFKERTEARSKRPTGAANFRLQSTQVPFMPTPPPPFPT